MAQPATIADATDRPPAEPPPGMVHVPAGPFLYGKDRQEKSLGTFHIDRHPVTNEQYQEFIDATGHRAPFLPPQTAEWAEPYNWVNRKHPKGKERHPVVLIAWTDAMAYASWAGTYLPMEGEWEKAARGTDGRRFPWGNGFAPSRCNTKESEIRQTTPVDAYEKWASPYGCLDMAGNVWEWTDSWDDEGRRFRVLRGGSWLASARYALCYSRKGLAAVRKEDLRTQRRKMTRQGLVALGFRCAWRPPQEGA